MAFYKPLRLPTDLPHQRKCLNTPTLTFAAIDLGSNSFHLTLAVQADNALHWQHTLSEKVQLAAGLNHDMQLDASAVERGLACLTRFAQHLDGIAPIRLRAVATCALRMAHNSADFIGQAERILGHPIHIISGEEEAQLINLGVAHTLSDPQTQRLAIDIGGGSTELVIGQGTHCLTAMSRPIGCIGFTQRFFADDLLTPANYNAALQAASQQLQDATPACLALGWQQVYGSSGTIKAIVHTCGKNNQISLDDIAQLKTRLWQHARLDDLVLNGVPPDRSRIVPAGLAILEAVLLALHIDTLTYVSGALREGVIHQLLYD